MAGARAARRTDDEGDLFARIGAFLVDHRLTPEPAHYAFVYAVLNGDDPELATAVARLTDGGVRLTAADIERLGGRVARGRSPSRAPRPTRAPVDQAVARLAAQTQAQVEGFASMVEGIRDEARGFGRDLEQSAAAIDRGHAAGGHDVARITGAMIKRVRDSEQRLAQATDEADALRVKLADARAAARSDPLTGLANRLAFDEAFSGRGDADAPYCLALCDIDRFKSINDRHGHGVGDRVLRAIGETLATVCGGHLVTRHGGEEFAVLIHRCSLTDAAACIDEARVAVGARLFRLRESEQPIGGVTFSAGVVAVRDGESAEQALDRADRLLYDAKEQGRNRVCAG